MREFKFRAWHHGGGDPRVSGEMFYSHPFPIIFWKRIEDECLSVEVMQYTGLKDKNGKYIYEGDILKTINNKNALVFFVNGVFALGGDPGREILCTACAMEEVIGNIYEHKYLIENPELLESK